MNSEEINKEFYEKYILSNPFELTRDIIVSQCRKMDKDDIYTWVYEDEKKIQQLQQENEQLKELLKPLNENERFVELNKENQQLKETIEKAKEELKKHITFCKNDSQGIHEKCNINIRHEESVLNILNGDDK